MVRIKKKYIKYIWFYLTKVHNFRMVFEAIYIKLIHRALDEYKKSELAKNKFSECFIKTEYGKFITSPSFTWFLVAPYYEEKTKQFIDEIVKKDETKDKIFLNIGANIGVFIVQFGKYFKKNIAIEADPKNFKYLKCNVILNDLEDRCVLINKAAGNEEAEAFFFHNYWKDSSSKIVRDVGQVPERYRKELIKVKIEPVEKMFSEDPRKIKLILMDVEGFELEVLKGMKTILKSMEKDSYIIIEILEGNKDKITEFLKDFGFKFEKCLDERNYLFKKV